MPDPNVGKKVKVAIPGKRSIERVLKEDHQGLYVDYQNEVIRVDPVLNEFGEHNTRNYIKIYQGGN